MYTCSEQSSKALVFFGESTSVPLILAVPRMWAGNLVKSAGRSVRVDYRIYYWVWVTVDYVRERRDVGHTDGVGALGWEHSHDTSEIRIGRSMRSERKGGSWCWQRCILKFGSLVSRIISKMNLLWKISVYPAQVRYSPSPCWNKSVHGY